jgi:cytochrome c peroxidase
MYKSTWRVIVIALAWLLTGCGDSQTPIKQTVTPSPADVQNNVVPDRDLRLVIFSPLPWVIAVECNPMTPVKVELGRMLFYDGRLSKNHDIACNTCHLLDRYGVDGLSTARGHKDQVGERNAPTVYHAAGHFTQFWDGRSPDVEDQAKGPTLNPIEMAMTDADAVVTVLESIPGYVSRFSAAFPDEENPVTFKNMAKAIGAFERGLVTPSRFDTFLAGDDNALSESEQAGLQAFLDTGCSNCHAGPYLGGDMFQKLGLMKSWDKDTDQGRFDVTGDESDRQVFKVPSLRNVVETGPYFHNGSIAKLEDAVELMAEHQLGKTIGDEQVRSIVTFLESLTGEIDKDYIARPELPESSVTTPVPDSI